MSKGDDTRTTILRHALGEASRMGLEGLSIGTLARDVGMSKSGLFAHFGSKEELQIAVLRTAGALFADRVLRPALSLPRGEPRVIAIFHNWLAWTGSAAVPGGCLFVSSASEFDDRPGPVRDVIAELVGDWRDAMARAARFAVEEGHFRADLDPEQLAFEEHGVMLAYHIQARLLDREQARPLALRAFDRLIADAR